MSLTNAYVISTKSDIRKTNDYYPTSPLATHCLIEKYKDIIPKKVWEPAAGRGWISKTLQGHGYNVISTDLYEYNDPFVKIKSNVDYLKQEPLANCVITNPPYKNNMALKFTKKAIEESDFVAVYLRLTFMESKGRYQFFKKNPPNVLVFSGRMNCDEEKFDTFKGQMGGMVAYAWYVWGKDVEPGRIDWIDPTEIAQKYVQI